MAYYLLVVAAVSLAACVVGSRSESRRVKFFATLVAGGLLGATFLYALAVVWPTL